MPTVILGPNPVFSSLTNAGVQLAAGKLWTYQAGTSTPMATYTDSTGSVANTNPIILNSRGECNYWLVQGQAYKLVLQDAAGVQIWSEDNIVGIGNALSAATTDALVSVHNTPYANELVITQLRKNDEVISPFRFMTDAQIADVQAGTMSFDVTAPMNYFLAAVSSDTRGAAPFGFIRSEEHTSELQSR
jgi:hypothetical protein